MKKRTLLVALAFPALLPALSQTREETLADFDWLTGYVQRNYPGYEIKTQNNTEEWMAWTDSLRSMVAQQPDTLPFLLDEYIRRFGDGHLYLSLTKKGREQFRDAIQREMARLRTSQQPQAVNMYFTARPMNDSTFFLRVPSFADDTANKMIRAHWAEITARPYLIVDLRNNKGGNDEHYDALMALAYSRPYLAHGVEQYATPDFLRLFESLVASDPDTDGAKYLQTLADSMKAHMGGYVLRPGLQRIRLVRRDSVCTLPRKVALLIHGRNASSAEQFILEAKESEKTVLFGNERTAGVLDLSNVFSITSPSGWLQLHIPTTRSCRWPDIVIDGVGIAPQIPVPYKESLQEKDSIGEEIRYIERVLRGIPCPNAAESSAKE